MAQSDPAAHSRDSLELILKQHPADTAGARALLQLANLYLHNNPALSKQYALRQLKLSEKIGYKRGIGAAYHSLGVCYNYLDNRDSAKVCLKNAIQIYSKIGLIQQKSNALNALGAVYANTDSTVQAKRIAEQIISEIPEKGNEKAHATSYEMLGILLQRMGDYEKAQQMALKSVEMRQKSGDMKGLAYSYMNLAISCENINDLESCSHYHLLADSILRGIRDYYGLAHANRGLSGVLSRLDQHPQALKAAEDAMHYAQLLGDSNLISIMRFQKGVALSSAGRNEEALTQFYPVIHANSFLQLSEEKIAVHTEIAHCLFKLQRAEEALPWIEKAIRMTDSSGSPKTIIRAFQTAYEIYQQLGNFAEANTMLKRQLDAEDHETERIVAWRIAEMQAKFNASEKQREIDLQQAELRRVRSVNWMLALSAALGVVIILLMMNQARILRRSRRITEENNRLLLIQKAEISDEKENMEMKALLSQMNPHFIFNSLNSIQKFILRNDSETASDYLVKFGNLMRLILENSDQKDVPIRDELRLIDLYMQLEQERTAHSFDFKLSASEELEESLLRIPPMVLQPYLENAVWHGVSPLRDRRGVIKLMLQRTGNTLRCAIEDNGVGSAGAVQNKGATRRVTGMGITRKRIENLWRKHNDFRTVTTEDLKDSGGNITGTLVSFELPISTIEEKQT